MDVLAFFFSQIIACGLLGLSQLSLSLHAQTCAGKRDACPPAMLALLLDQCVIASTSQASSAAATAANALYWEMIAQMYGASSDDSRGRHWHHAPPQQPLQPPRPLPSLAQPRAHSWSGAAHAAAAAAFRIAGEARRAPARESGLVITSHYVSGQVIEDDDEQIMRHPIARGFNETNPDEAAAQVLRSTLATRGSIRDFMRSPVRSSIITTFLAALRHSWAWSEAIGFLTPALLLVLLVCHLNCTSMLALVRMRSSPLAKRGTQVGRAGALGKTWTHHGEKTSRACSWLIYLGQRSSGRPISRIPIAPSDGDEQQTTPELEKVQNQMLPSESIASERQNLTTIFEGAQQDESADAQVCLECPFDSLVLAPFRPPFRTCHIRTPPPAPHPPFQ